jgi:hypothetical protein
MMKNLIRVLAVSLTFAAIAHADDLQLGVPAYGGTGCPGGSASVSLAPDQKSISILFDSYVAQAGGSTAFDRKNCNIAIPVHVPQGWSVSVFDIDYRGFVGLPAGGRATLNVDYFLSTDPRGLHTSKSFTGPIATDYLKQDQIGLAAVVWTPCGADTILRSNTTLLAMSNAAREETMATVDSADIHAGLIFNLQWRRCN